MKKQEIIALLGELGMSPAEENDLEAKTFDKGASKDALLAFYKEVNANTEEKTPEPKGEKEEEKKEEDQDEEQGEKEKEKKEEREVVRVKVLSNLKRNGKRYKIGENAKFRMCDQIQRLLDNKILQIV